MAIQATCWCCRKGYGHNLNPKSHSLSLNQWTLISIFKFYSSIKPVSTTQLHHVDSAICLVTITISPILAHIGLHNTLQNTLQNTLHIAVYNTIPDKAAFWTYLIFKEYESRHLCWHIYCLHVVCPCHLGMARPQVADRGTASDMGANCEYIE